MFYTVVCFEVEMHNDKTTTFFRFIKRFFFNDLINLTSKKTKEVAQRNVDKR
jgi:hypothetical protein